MSDKQKMCPARENILKVKLSLCHGIKSKIQYSKSFVFDQLPSPLPNFGIVFKVIIDKSPPF